MDLVILVTVPSCGGALIRVLRILVGRARKVVILVIPVTAALAAP